MVIKSIEKWGSLFCLQITDIFNKKACFAWVFIDKQNKKIESWEIHGADDDREFENIKISLTKIGRLFLLDCIKIKKGEYIDELHTKNT